MPITSSSSASVTTSAVALQRLSSGADPRAVFDAEDQAQAELSGRFCPRCERHALYGIECAYCGHVIITGMVIKPCHPPAWSEGCCPVCFTTDPEVWEAHGRLLCTVCAQGRSRWGDRVKAAPGWQERARRVLAWVDEPGSMSYATEYAPEADGDDGRQEGNARANSVSPVVTPVGQ
ncbi:hypothetical protein OG883_44200 [Streptomyces sp. NBC_01142]|uniref:hypothetical protein n=1 Tax=Streptomyces sp. NBC_01142 TaxID=2975865 RepID=UPI002258D5DF|nr:hypothetical protein [Streptomyces sp. NBC_01142]MCX4826646.1 hypothetical protein [Streptomyces sp. NBC_01142]